MNQKGVKKPVNFLEGQFTHIQRVLFSKALTFLRYKTNNFIFFSKPDYFQDGHSDHGCCKNDSKRNKVKNPSEINTKRPKQWPVGKRMLSPHQDLTTKALMYCCCSDVHHNVNVFFSQCFFSQCFFHNDFLTSYWNWPSKCATSPFKLGKKKLKMSVVTL